MKQKQNQQLFIEQKYEEGLETIRSRISALNTKTATTFVRKADKYNEEGNGTARKNASSTTFMGKLDNLSQELEEVLGSAQELRVGKK